MTWSNGAEPYLLVLGIVMVAWTLGRELYHRWRVYADSRPRVDSYVNSSGDTPDPAPQHIARPPSDEKPR